MKQRNYAELGAMGGPMAVAAVVFFARGSRLPGWIFDVVIALATVAAGYGITLGPQANDSALTYVIPVLYAAYLFTRRRMLIQVAVIGVVHAVVLLTWALPEERAVRWFNVVACCLVGGWLLSSVRDRMNGALSEVSRLASTDALTGILNRRGFDEQLRIEIARAVRHGASLSLVTFDLDHFKQLNDTYGHPAGDRALKVFGKLLAAEGRSTDVVARVGGEEFAALLGDTSLEGAVQFAERLRSALPEAIAKEGLAPLTVSAGVAEWPPDPPLHEQFIEIADRALYEAKLLGRNQVRIGGAPAVDVVSAGSFRSP